MPFRSLLVADGLSLIFDMDGVIIDSNPVHTQAWLAYLKKFNLVVDNLEQRMFGRRNDELVRELFGEHLTDEEVFSLGAAKEALYRSMMKERLTESLVPGLVEFLSASAHAPAGVATNAEPANVDFVLDGAGIRDRFQAIVDGHQVSRPKPHPEIYLKVANLLQTNPENCIVFEDSYAGAEAARAAGARVVGLKTSHSEFPDVDLAIQDFRDPALVAWIRQQRPRS